ncbi:MAG: hypothetical protein ACREFV_12845 [Acetobacteraceae bacterium]
MVDLVQPGATLAANGLVITEVIAPITSRLIVNRSAVKTGGDDLFSLIAGFRRAVGAI